VSPRIASLLTDGSARTGEVCGFLGPGAPRGRLSFAFVSTPRASGMPSGFVLSRESTSQTRHHSTHLYAELDTSDALKARRELERRASIDALTDCHNRASTMAALERDLRVARPGQLALIYVDLDRFKSINDTFGHGVGDEVLVMVAERLKAATRQSGTRVHDVVGRLGGDEFLLLIRGLPDPELAVRVATRVSESLARPLEVSCGKVKLAASIGVAWPEEDAVSPDELIRRADEAMYRSKAERRGLPVLAVG
jgi:diguanylate cyclase (GGDEF)-like protein